MFSIGIIGYGRFGSLLYSIFKKAKPEIDVRVYSRYEEINKKIFFSLEDTLASDIVIPCMAISDFEQFIKDHVALIKPGSLVMDVCSVKIHPAEVMRKYVPENIDILATHPMFGPDSTKNGTTFDGFKFIYYPLRITNRARLDRVLDFFSGLGLQIIKMTPKEHDKQAAYSHAFAFFVGKVGQKMKITKSDVSTKGFEGLLYNQMAVENDTGQLFKDMNAFNPYTREMRKKFAEAVEEINKELD